MVFRTNGQVSGQNKAHIPVWKVIKENGAKVFWQFFHFFSLHQDISKSAGYAGCHRSAESSGLILRSS